MAEILQGAPVAYKITKASRAKAEELRSQKVIPTLAIIRFGDKSDDVSYEKGAMVRAVQTGIRARSIVLDENTEEHVVINVIENLNRDIDVHGILILKPLPEHLSEDAVADSLDPYKDVDGITCESMAGICLGRNIGFPSCVAEACIELLDYYDIELKGKKVTVLGRSAVAGKPVALMAMERGGTVTICHSQTTAKNFIESSRNADIVISALGKPGIASADSLGENQTVVDVGINVGKDGRICGDVDFETAKEKAAAITPVPGGIGSVTTAILMKHVVEAASWYVPKKKQSLSKGNDDDL